MIQNLRKTIINLRSYEEPLSFHKGHHRMMTSSEEKWGGWDEDKNFWFQQYLT
jgi:hypothetical protein